MTLRSVCPITMTRLRRGSSLPATFMRGHGPGGRYKGSYSQPTLLTWADQIETWRNSNKTLYVYFDNDQKSASPKDAKRLIALCS
jgi:uncharacterized protein YecE (DUF72 family)